MSDIFFPPLHPKATKAHDCDQCGREIQHGEKYRKQAFKFDGRVGISKMCLQCEVFCRMLAEVGFENTETGGWPYIPEVDASEISHCGFYVQYGLFRNRWRDGEGDLVPPEAVY